MVHEISIATARTRDDAEVIRGLLGTAGIEAWVVADDAGGAYPFPLTAGVHVMVDESDRDAATAIVSQTRSNRD